MAPAPPARHNSQAVGLSLSSSHAVAVLAGLALLPLCACSGRDRQGSSPAPESGGLDPVPPRLLPTPVTPIPAPPAFDAHVLDATFRGEGAAVFDVDRDGHLDIVTDQYWYAGPSFTPHEIRTPQIFDGATGYSVCQAVFGVDVDGDGWTDAVVSPFMWDPAAPPPEPMLWYRNPRGAAVHWTSHLLAPSTAVETTVAADLFGDGRVEIIMGQEPPEVLQW
ncbi:MAG: FG-GAP repeat domain-containing protein, partial [Polyangiaceae bacterium]